MIDDVLYEFMREQLATTSHDFVRYLYPQIDWTLRMFGLVGPRGVGKSTLIKQHIIFEKDNQKALYISADHSYFANHTLLEVASEWNKEGGTHLYIDEIHKYENWSTELKNIYDGYGALKVVFTGSSVLAPSCTPCRDSRSANILRCSTASRYHNTRWRMLSPTK